MNHEWMLKFLQHRVADPRILSLVRKWLKAGVSEDGEWSETKVGVPQGAVVSPLLANIYLHYVFDLWAQVWREKIATGDMIMVRYADDLVMGFEHRADAERFLNEFRERLAKFGLELHPDKTRLIEFGRYAIPNRQKRGEGKPETVPFLGFTHCWARTFKSGAFTISRRTIGARLRAKLKQIQQQLRRRMHDPVNMVGEWLHKVVTGYFLYHAVPGNTDSLNTFRHRLSRIWRQVLRRRSQKYRLNWDDLRRHLDRWLPHPRVLHPYPSERFDATHPR